MKTLISKIKYTIELYEGGYIPDHEAIQNIQSYCAKESAQIVQELRKSQEIAKLREGLE